MAREASCWERLIRAKCVRSVRRDSNLFVVARGLSVRQREPVKTGRELCARMSHSSACSFMYPLPILYGRSSLYTLKPPLFATKML